MNYKEDRFYIPYNITMSIQITYRKAVIKLPDGRTLPILESWSSNCFEVLPNGRRGRRERSRRLLSKMIWTKETVEPYIKSRAQRYIDDNERDDCKQWTEQTWKTMDSWYRASWRFPGHLNLDQVIKYITNPNIDLDIADQYITLRVQGGSEYVKPSDIDKLLNGTSVRLDVSGVDYAIREQQKREKILQA